MCRDAGCSNKSFICRICCVHLHSVVVRPLLLCSMLCSVVRWWCCSVLVNDSATTSYGLHAAKEYHKREKRLRLWVHFIVGGITRFKDYRDKSSTNTEIVQQGGGGARTELQVLLYLYNIIGVLLCIYFIQHCFICRPSESIVPEDAEIEPRTVATFGMDSQKLLPLG